jgi:hypothetical protein
LAGQVVPQSPQFEALERTSTHVPSHDMLPVGHAHTPFSHDVPPWQTTPHPPQFMSSLAVETHELPHDVVPWAQTAITQDPASHFETPRADPASGALDMMPPADPEPETPPSWSFTKVTDPQADISKARLTK